MLRLQALVLGLSLRHFALKVDISYINKVTSESKTKKNGHERLHKTLTVERGTKREKKQN